jgi:SAM-dependent methyltransferase
MPEMAEIYLNHAGEYDELVRHEDYRNALGTFLERLIPPGIDVLEAGTGTGRVTSLYIGRVRRALCCDRSEHMLAAARSNLSHYSGKIDFRICDNVSLDSIDGLFDCVVEGWSFGHTIIDSADPVKYTASRLVSACRRKLSPGGRMIIIETLGTNTPGIFVSRKELDDFYIWLENESGFSREVVRTDYRFESPAEAKRIMGFFFGNQMAASVNSAEIPEFTGVWHKIF